MPPSDVVARPHAPGSRHTVSLSSVRLVTDPSPVHISLEDSLWHRIGDLAITTNACGPFAVKEGSAANR
jgi:hypothetical protein